MKQLKNRIFISMLAAMGISLGAGVVLFPLLLPTENYFRMAAQLFPMAIVTALLLIFPLHLLSFRFAKAFSEAKKKAAFSLEPAAPTVIDIPTEAAPPPPSQEIAPHLPKPRAPRRPRVPKAPAASRAEAAQPSAAAAPDTPETPAAAAEELPARPAKPRAPRKPRAKKSPAAKTDTDTPAAAEQPAGDKPAEDKLPVP